MSNTIEVAPKPPDFRRYSLLRIVKIVFGSAALILVWPGLAAAYVGPGAGISLLGALWGLLAGVVVAIGVVLFWPIRALIRKARGSKSTSADEAERTSASDADEDQIGKAEQTAKPPST